MENYKKPAGRNNKYYMYGKHAVFAALANPRRIIEQVYCLEKTLREHGARLPGTKTEVVAADFIHKKIGADQPHQGIIACVRSIFFSGVNEMQFGGETDRVVILDQITDPQNIGAIIRGAAAFGITKLILTADNAPGENAAIAKAASGCLELMQVAKVTNLKSTIEKLKKQQFWVAGLDSKGKNELGSLGKFDRLAIIIGSESKGLRRLTQESCDLLVKIPISDKVESLNASNAAAIVFYALGPLAPAY